MEDLRTIFMLFGVFLIVAVTAHGLWTIRKNAKKKSEREAAIAAVREANERSSREHAEQGFDELGLGPVRVVRQEPSFEQEQPDSEDTSLTEQPVKDEVNTEQPRDESVEPAFEKTPTESELAAENKEPVVESEAQKSEPKTWQSVDADIPAPPSSLLKKAADVDAKPERAEPKLALVEEPSAASSTAKQAEKKPSFADKARKLVHRDKPKTHRRREPKVAEDQLRMDFDDMEAQAEQEKPAQKPAEPAEQEVLVLNVKMPDDTTMSGAALLPILLTLGFKFGDQNIFHRHVNSSGKGPVLFSLANMFKPGVFDVDNMEHFNTRGVSLFMILPIEGDPHQVFNMMHNAARKIADEFGAQVLDSRRSVLTKQGLQQYVEKIREAERRRMLHK